MLQTRYGAVAPDKFPAMSLAVLFPGQGSQTPDMRAQVERVRPDLLEAARRELGEDPFERADEGTRWAQPAIYCAALAGWTALEDELSPALLAGHSLGEIAALVAAEAVDELDGLRLVIARGRLMQEVAEASEAGGMLAVLGDRGELVPRVARRHGLTVANDNAPGQLVLSGPRTALDEAARELEAERLRTRTLNVGGAFHSPALSAAERPFRAILESLELRDPRIPVFSCVTAEPFGDPTDLLARALTSPVRWREVLHELWSRGARVFTETGPGRVLTGLVKRTLEGVETRPPRRAEAAHA